MSGLAKFLLCFGIFCLFLAGFLFWQRHTPRRLAFATTQINTDIPVKTKLPTEIIITDVDIHLAIIEAKIEKNKWTATSKGVSYLISSPVPGNVGNSIMYGHNWSNLLGKITRLKPNQQITIKFNDNSYKDFVIVSTKVVSPEDISVLQPSNEPIVTLYTCTGFLDSKRFVLAAKPL